MKGKKTGGRKKGTPNQATVARQALEAHAAAEGVTPLEYMLSLMRTPIPPEVAAALADMKDLNDENLVKAIAALSGWHGMRFEAAKAAAPYVHAKKVDHTSGGEPINPPAPNSMTVELDFDKVMTWLKKKA